MTRAQTLRRRAGAALLALLLALPPAVPAQSGLPQLGDGSDLTLAQERRLGERIARELYRDPDYIDDPILVDYVDGIWQRLLQAARARGDLGAGLDERFAWQVLLGRDRTVNAFALPGGWMGLHLGLISVTTSTDEVASVLAHELSHVTQRHIARMATEEKRQTPLVLAAMLLGALAASRNPQMASAVMGGSQALAIQGQLNFSRDMEREADRIGYGVAGQAGFDPQGFVSMFEKLQQASRLNDTGSFPYLRTHPLTTERVADMQARHQLAPRQEASQPARALHALMAGRSRFLSNLDVDALRTAVAEGRSVPPTAPVTRRLSAWVAGALAAARLREFDQAEALLARLRETVRGDAALERVVAWTAAEIALAAAQPQRAAALAAETGPGRPGLLLWARAQLAAGGPAPVVARLQTWVADHPRDATAWTLLGQAQAAAGMPLRALRAEAEASAALLDPGGAVDRLRAAQELTRRAPADLIESSIIDTRLRQLESVLREQALER